MTLPYAAQIQQEILNGRSQVPAVVVEARLAQCRHCGRLGPFGCPLLPGRRFVATLLHLAECRDAPCRNWQGCG